MQTDKPTIPNDSKQTAVEDEVASKTEINEAPSLEEESTDLSISSLQGFSQNIELKITILNI